MTFDDFDPGRQPDPADRRASAAAVIAVRSMLKPEQMGGAVILSGPSGVGKSHLLKAALWEIADRRVNGYYITASEFDRWSKDFDARPWVQERRRATLTTSPLLCLDDVGSGQREGSAWVRERFEDVFDERYRAGLPALLTTNLTEREFRDAVGVRTWDRLRDNGKFLYMPGISLRG